ncbi:hypothetical protein V5F32_09490 [Xanthobacter oligotrophicus]|uniref:Uncharacterized protein n=1 Tax=Xanthobacter oligotrophicus TaxID=2607286 RepID=A0ABW6ZUK3_9HYPH
MELLSIIGSLASIASLAVQFGVLRYADGSVNIHAAIEGIRNRLTTSQQEALKIDGAAEFISILVIDPELLSDINKAIQLCIKRYRDRLQSGKSQAEREVADRQAERCVCENLNRVRRRNGGSLPGEMEKWWIQYRCISDFDY